MMPPTPAAPPAPPAPLLDVRGLTVGFLSGTRVIPAVQDVSFAIAPAETLCLVGESGCGKSATALALLRLLPPSSRIVAGRVLFDERDLLQLPEDELRTVRGAGIGFVFQEPMAALNPVFTVGDHVAEALVVHGRAGWAAARRRAVELLDAVRIPDAAQRARDYPHQLSGGLRQRAMIAIALACGPRLLIADEPTTALDVRLQAEVLDLLRDLRQRFGLAMLLITHDLGVAAETGDRIAVMYAGRIVEQGAAGDVLARPLHPYTQGLIQSVPGRHSGARLGMIEGAVPAPGSLPPGCAFEPRCRERLPVCAEHMPADVAVELASGAPARAVRCHLHQPG